MEITHRTKNLPITARKLRLVADKMRYQKAEKALELLPLLPQKGARLLRTSLASAVQVAKDNDMDSSTLVIQQIWGDEGRRLKRYIGHSRGRMAPIQKLSSHLSIVLTGEVQTKRRTKKVATTDSVTTEEK